jgi:hypothetical protein
MALVSTIDVVPTILSILKSRQLASTTYLDGVDISSVLFGREAEFDTDNRVLFFWRDGFEDGPLAPPYGRFDVVAVKLGRIKAWFWTKSAHYNKDLEVEHDPPLLFDTVADPAEAYPLGPNERFWELIQHIKSLVREHKKSIDWTYTLALAQDPQYVPCADKASRCRTGVGINTMMNAAS